MKLSELKNLINNGSFDSKFVELYDANAVAVQRERYLMAIDSFYKRERRYGGINKNEEKK